MVSLTDLNTLELSLGSSCDEFLAIHSHLISSKIPQHKNKGTRTH